MEQAITLILIVIKLALILVVILTMAAYLVLAERKILGRMQLRHGPNRVGPFGLLQPLADLIKLISKEDFVPQRANKLIFLLAPSLSVITVLLIFAVVPFSPPLHIFGREIPMVVCDLNVGLLFFIALSSLSVYGVTFGGWASNSKYAMLGGIRATAQLISYELPMGLALIPLVLVSGSFSLTDIVNAQQVLPFAVTQPLAFMIFFTCILAETKRTPFDLPEAENELVAGYHTEYSGLRFGMFFVGEYINMALMGAVTTVFFLGGWHGPILPPIVWFMGKVLFLCFILIWIRGTLPRFRYDQLMRFGWQVLIPLSLLNLLITGAVLLWLRG